MSASATHGGHKKVLRENVSLLASAERLDRQNLGQWFRYVTAYRVYACVRYTCVRHFVTLNAVKPLHKLYTSICQRVDKSKCRRNFLIASDAQNVVASQIMLKTTKKTLADSRKPPVSQSLSIAKRRTHLLAKRFVHKSNCLKSTFLSQLAENLRDFDLRNSLHLTCLLNFYLSHKELYSLS